MEDICIIGSHGYCDYNSGFLFDIMSAFNQMAVGPLSHEELTKMGFTLCGAEYIKPIGLSKFKYKNGRVVFGNYKASVSSAESLRNIIEYCIGSE